MGTCLRGLAARQMSNMVILLYQLKWCFDSMTSEYQDTFPHVKSRHIMLFFSQQYTLYLI